MSKTHKHILIEPINNNRWVIHTRKKKQKTCDNLHKAILYLRCD